MISKEVVKNVCGKYVSLFPQEKETPSFLSEQIQSNEDMFSRKNFHGHITASGLVVSLDRKVLAIFHNKLQKYLQPGGHIEKEDRSFECAARREVIEEAGLQNIILHPWHKKFGSPILIDTHPIPENVEKQEDAHCHHDFMFVFSTKNTNVSLDHNEVSHFTWIDIDTVIQGDSNISKALKKMQKLGIVQKPTSKYR
jgi:8-oxo-dGTP pyrophosphatase MutT (NUDIX family)